MYDFIKQQITGQLERKETEAQLSTALESWLYDEKYGTVKASSYDRIEQIYKYQIAPHITGLRTADVSARDIKKIMDASLECGYSYSTLLKIYRLLHEFFEVRRRVGDLARNPLDTLKMYSRDFVLRRQAEIRAERDAAIAKESSGKALNEKEKTLVASQLKMEDQDEIRILTDAEIARLRDVAYNGYYLEWISRCGKPVRSGPFVHKQAKYFIFLLNTGLRKGEAMALRYSDVDFDRKTISINANRTTAKRREADGRATGGTETIEGSPKTKKSLSVIPVSDTALQILREMHDEEAEGYDGYIINDNGRPIVESAFRRRFNSLLRQAKVDHCGLHSLRHTFASKLFQATGGNAKLVSEMVRHASASFTENAYVHLLEGEKENVVSDFKI